MLENYRLLLVRIPEMPTLSLESQPFAVLLLLAVTCLVLAFFRRKGTRAVSQQALSDTQGAVASRVLDTLSSPPQPVPEEQMGTGTVLKELAIDVNAVKQPYDAFLVLDVEATCMPGTDFSYPNEIIEWPVCLLQWKAKDSNGKASRLEIVDEFRSFVKPVWRPQLHPFCTALTGITQGDVDSAPRFSDLIVSFRQFLVRNGLIDPVSGNPLVRYCWCSDGPWDVRDFVVKQCFISKVPLPMWIAGDVMDVRLAVGRWRDKHDPTSKPRTQFSVPKGAFLPITRQLQLLGLPPFQGRQHCGIDDTRNVARIVIELARRGVRMKPNTPINPDRRWPWMGKRGRILEEYCVSPGSPFS